MGEGVLRKLEHQDVIKDIKLTLSLISDKVSLWKI